MLLHEGRASVPARTLRGAGDERLVALVRDGSEPAFEALYDRHHRAILSFCRHLVGGRQEAEDALQQTFLAAYRGLMSSDKPIAFKPWLYTIARNQCINALRARRERAVAEPEDLAPITEGLADQVQRREDLREVLVDLRRLPEDQRAALVLSELGDLSHDEIGDVIGVRTDKVKALVFQAREALAGARDARAIPCGDIRVELATARGGALRRAPLRRHLAACDGCRSFKDEVARQRRALAVLLPVTPSVGLKAGALPWAAGGGAAGGGAIAGGAAAVGGGAAATGGGAAATGLSALASTTAAKVLLVGAVAAAGAGGVVGAKELRATDDTSAAPASANAGAGPASSASPVAQSSTPPKSTSSQGVTPVRRAGKGGNSVRAKERAAARKRERALLRKKGKKDSPPGQARGGGNGKVKPAKQNGTPNGNSGGSSKAGGKGTGGGGSSNAGGNGKGNGRAPTAAPPPPPAAEPVAPEAVAPKGNGNGAVNGGGAKANGKGPGK